MQRIIDKKISIYDKKKFFRILSQSGLIGYLLLFKPILLVLVSRGRQSEEYTQIDQSALIQILFTFIVFLGILVDFYRNKSFGRTIKVLNRKPLIFFSLYLIWSCLTVFWSSVPLLSIYRLIENIVYLLAIILILDKYRFNINEGIYYIIYYSIWVYLIAFVKHFITNSGYSIGSFHGTGALTTAPLLFLVLYFHKRVLLKILFLIITILTTATTMYVAVFLVQSVALLTYPKKAGSLVFFVIITVVSIIYGLNTIKGVAFYGKEERTIETGTGRLPYYELAYEAGKEHPIRGWGFCALNESTKAWNWGVNMQNAHNFILESFVTTGVIGTFLIITLFASTIISSFKKARYRSRDNDFYYSIFYTVICLFIVSLLNPSIGGRVWGAWFACVQIFVIYTQYDYYNMFKIY